MTAQAMNGGVDPQTFIEQIATRACQELFARYGVTITPAGDDEVPVTPEFLLCSIIGFTGREIRGTLLLALTEELPGLSSPIANALPQPVKEALMQRDWVGELSNQLLGRVKIELLRSGVEIYLNLPAMLRGQHLAPLPRSHCRPLKFTMAGGAVAVWLEIEAPPSFKIEPHAAPHEAGPSAGETLLFD